MLVVLASLVCRSAGGKSVSALLGSKVCFCLDGWQKSVSALLGSKSFVPAVSSRNIIEEELKAMYVLFELTKIHTMLFLYV